VLLFKPEGRFPPNLLVSDDALGEADSRFFSLDAWAEGRGLSEHWCEAARAGLVQVAKASKAEKNEGIGETVSRCKKGARPCDWANENKSPNNHTTVKPVTLMSYLIHLACPPGGLVLDPFVGSGTTCVAAIQGGFRSIGIELDPSYCEIARARCEHTAGQVEPEQPVLEGVTHA